MNNAYPYIILGMLILVSLTGLTLSGQVVLTNDDYTISIKQGRTQSTQTSCGAGWQRVSSQQRQTTLSRHQELQCTDYLPQLGAYCCQTPKFNGRV